MSSYMVYTGLDVALVDLDLINPQPSSSGVQYTRRTPSADGSVYDQGGYISLDFSALANAAAYQALLAQFGLDAATTGAVTIYARNEQWTFTRYNGLAVRPAIGDSARWEIFPKQISIIVKNLVAL